MRLIDAERVSATFREEAAFLLKNGPDTYGTGRARGLIDAADIIDRAFAVDAVPVVRCKDCKYWTQDGNGYLDDQAHCGNPYGIDGYTDSGDFCSCGERRCDNG